MNRFVVVLFSLFVFGCGSSPSVNDAGPQIEPRIDAAKSETCNFTNCTGCCNGSTCVKTIDKANCGQPGRACETCTGANICAAGQCVPPQDCSDCAGGCCLDGTQCVEGNTKDACGSGGNACSDCTGDDNCSENSCQATTCDATNCANGCCTANGECVTTAQSKSACGKGGAACEVCETDAISCTLGVCVLDQPCLDFCDQGCCTANGQCILFADQAPAQCGAAAMCSPCSGELNCLSGSCTPDPVWSVKMRSAIIAPTDPNGDPWDYVTIFDEDIDALPDPEVSGEIGGDLTYDWYTKVKPQNTLTPNWNETVFSYAQSALISKGLDIRIKDSDGLSFETIGSCSVVITQADLDAGGMTVAQCGLATSVRFGFTQL